VLRSDRKAGSVTGMWRLWPERTVQITSGRFEGAAARVLRRSRKRTVIVVIERGHAAAGRCVKVRRSEVRPTTAPLLRSVELDCGTLDQRTPDYSL
jgi:hypothetical protein